MSLSFTSTIKRWGAYYAFLYLLRPCSRQHQPTFLLVNLLWCGFNIKHQLVVFLTQIDVTTITEAPE